MSKADGVGERAVEAEAAGKGAADLRRLNRVEEPGAVQVALGHDEHLGLVLEAPEMLAVDQPIAVALERRPGVSLRLGLVPTVGPRGVIWRAEMRERTAVLNLMLAIHRARVCPNTRWRTRSTPVDIVVCGWVRKPIIL